MQHALMPPYHHVAVRIAADRQFLAAHKRWEAMNVDADEDSAGVLGLAGLPFRSPLDGKTGAPPPQPPQQPQRKSYQVRRVCMHAACMYVGRTHRGDAPYVGLLPFLPRVHDICTQRLAQAAIHVDKSF